MKASEKTMRLKDRFERAERWLSPILNGLNPFLIGSICLFIFGLLYQLWNLPFEEDDHSVLLILTGATASLLSLLVGLLVGATIILAVLYEESPFKSPISLLLRNYIIPLINKSPKYPGLDRYSLLPSTRNTSQQEAKQKRADNDSKLTQTIHVNQRMVEAQKHFCDMVTTMTDQALSDQAVTVLPLFTDLVIKETTQFEKSSLWKAVNRALSPYASDQTKLKMVESLPKFSQGILGKHKIVRSSHGLIFGIHRLENDCLNRLSWSQGEA
ncbi:hypothetical protein SISNIDRAFT_253399 [Sistotremastrum niveocremeum HHB9708]|uniref:Uncharacterized protein n=1 Tax=Sistotremastrum niveocremeum HHB9708 TaxID=1314777 RepID=A0A164PIK0_9AGAM|nr:hypothetical protein SISNIDRAFT_253399 [Sistotremastrum niveocremeum HHB9708]